MPGYACFLIDIDDQRRFSEYAVATTPTLAKYGGHVALRGPISDVVEGPLSTKEDTRLVVLEFDSLDSARRWYRSDEYRPLIELRESISASSVFFVDGFDLKTTGAGGGAASPGT